MRESDYETGPCGNCGGAGSQYVMHRDAEVLESCPRCAGTGIQRPERDPVLFRPAGPRKSMDQIIHDAMVKHLAWEARLNAASGRAVTS